MYTSVAPKACHSQVAPVAARLALTRWNLTAAKTCSDTSPASPSNKPVNYKPYRLRRRKKKPAGGSSSSARGLPGPEPANPDTNKDTPCDQATQPAVGRRERPCPKHLLPQLTNISTDPWASPCGTIVKAPIPVPAKQPSAKPLPSKLKVAPARFPQEATAVPPKQPSGPQ